MGGTERVPFYFLKCEYVDDTKDRTGSSLQNATCTVRVYGKYEDGATVAVELQNYRPNFFVSFSNRNVCSRNVKAIKQRLQTYTDRVTRNDGDNYVRPCHVTGVETATGYSSLIMLKTHQDRRCGSLSSSSSSSVPRTKERPVEPHRYGDTALLLTYRVYVRCFSHIRRAIREILETARDTAVEAGEYDGVASLERDVQFYESSLDANVRIAESLKLRPCQWCWLNTSACSSSITVPEQSSEYGHYGSNSLQKIQNRRMHVNNTYTYDFLRHIDTDVLKQTGRIAFTKLPFAEATTPLEGKLPPPVSVMSFDIECLANDVHVFPTPDVCSIIQIATVVAKDAINRPAFNNGDGSNQRRCLYTIDSCDPLDEHTVVKSFYDERAMLATFCADFVVEDPDILTGYYIENFDLPFLFARLSYHGLSPALGRFGLVSTCEKNDKRGSYTKKFASHIPKSHFTHIHGRTLFDACVFVRKEFSLRSYTLNAVSEHFLKSRKDDVHYTEIPALFSGGPQGRAVLGRYCVKDAQLVMDLVFNLQAFVNMYERCKVFNTTLEYMLDRGQQVRILSMLLKWCSARMILINDCTTPNSVFYDRTKTDMRERLYDYNQRSQSYGKRKPHGEGDVTCYDDDEDDDNDDDDDGDDGGGDNDDAVNKRVNGVKDRGGKSKNTRYDGAVVIDPKRGLYHDPVVCLDYASLYPSIMIAYNLCYSTMVLDRKHGLELLKTGAAVCSPVGHYFLSANIKKGALPSILETLIATRSDVRKRMARLEPTSTDYMLLNGQQAALKIAANSIYGATGCQHGLLYFLQIPSSVTAYGRQMITATKEFIENRYPDRTVVYGDTDSVMVRLTGWTTEHKRHLWDCTDAGTEMAESVTRLIDREPIKLQFETVYRPFLLANKKRYAAGVYTSLDAVKCVAKNEGTEAAQRMLDSARKEIKCKGLEVVRRDNCVFVKNTLQKTIDMIMDMKRPEDIVAILRRDIGKLLHGDVNIRDLIISKEWTKRTKNPTPHDRLAQKMAARNPGEAPHLGDRIQYIVIKSQDDGQEGGKKLCDRAEDPLYVLEHGLAIDYVYYADNQMLNPLTGVLHIAMPDSTREEIKDALWPSSTLLLHGENVPRRPSKKSTAPGPVKRSRRSKNTKHDVIPPNNRRLTSYFVSSKRATSGAPQTAEKCATRPTAELTDIEDVCYRLVDECRDCKKGDETAIASCKNRDCSLLYERYSQKWRIKNGAFDVKDKSYVNVLGFTDLH